MGVASVATVAVQAQQPPIINPRVPPPPPPPDPPPAAQPTPQPVPQPAPQPTAPPVAPTPEEAKPAPIALEPIIPPPTLPATVEIPAGTPIEVVLDTPLSTKITKKGQQVTFRTSRALSLGDQLELPAETAFTGSVVEVKRPGGFGKAGAMRVLVERVELENGPSAAVVAHLDSPDIKGKGRITTDNSRATDLYSLATYTLQGTLLGSAIKGGKGAAVGAGAGAMAALIIMMSRKGPDLYLEPGMPFVVILDQSVSLPAKDVYIAQQTLARARATASANASDLTNAGSSGSELERNPDGATLDSDRPKLKRRPK